MARKWPQPADKLVLYRRAVRALSGSMARRPSSRGPIDTYLEHLGLYRLKVPPQEPLFRIVSEQLCFTQTEYPRFKKMTCQRLLLTPEKYSQHTAEPMEEHVLKLREGRTAAGLAEMLALADITRHDFWLYSEIDQPPTNVTCRGFSQRIQVAGGDSSHYDLVISKQEATDRAMGQSMVYHTLYTNVYNLHNVEHAVDKMLYDKEYARTRKESLCSQDGALAAIIGKMSDSPEHETSSGSGGLYATSDEEPCDVMDILDRNMVPFPYKTAKALDGTHYRNLPQDVWTELVKERRREQQRPDCNGFLAGIKCLVELGQVLPADELAQLESEARPEYRHLSETGSTLYVAHIQEMSPNQGPVCCFVEPLGRKLTVPYASLRPLCSTPVPCPVSPSPGSARARTPGRRRSRHSTSERSSCGDRHLSHTDSSCSTPQELAWSAPSYMMSEPPAGLMSPVALPGTCDLSAMVHQPPQQYGVQLVGSPVFPPQYMPATSAAGLEPRLQALALAGPRPTEQPPVGPVIMSPAVHGQEPAGEPPPPPLPPLYPGWQLVAGPGGGPPVLVQSPPAAVSSPQTPYGPPLYQTPPHLTQPGFYGYAMPGPYEQQQQQQQQQQYAHQQQAAQAPPPPRAPGAAGGRGPGLYPLEVMSPPGPQMFAVSEPADTGGAFYSPGSAEESGYRSRNASHSSSNSVDGSVGDMNSPHGRNGGMRRGRPAVRPPKAAQPARNLPPRLSKFVGAGAAAAPAPPPQPPPPGAGALLYAVAPPFFYPPDGGGERMVLAENGSYYLAPPPPPAAAGYYYVPPQYPYPGQGQ
ncbi:protein ovarian tumor locus-like isoform X3 [Amphibalanus amphitrite]|uniref:protein ovarian tumor locus-like isoform X3 n=1 Tax=Amphibalanus amphitrite TaxID=1232801 RepID=UPI001C901A09|nr:protein ovarian tumor locus-like isoform X3 [Amphibalanus amphitrite]